MLDRIKDLGYKYSTISGISISMSDVIDYKGKQERIDQAEEKINEINEAFELGLMEEKERKMQELEKCGTYFRGERMYRKTVR